MSGGAVIDVRQRRTAAEWRALGVVCPRCRGALAEAGDAALACASCASRYDVVWGIPDLRTGDDPYLSRAEDLAAAERLASRAHELDFAGLFALYYEGNAKVPPAQVAQFTRGVLAAGARADAAIAVWLDGAADQRDVRTLAALDLGCGTGPLGIGLATRGARPLGVDVGMRWLVMARKRGVEAGVDLPVVCANAEALPIADGAMRVVAGESVLENLADPSRGVREVHRALAPGGQLWLATPNRRSIGPDPHLGVPAGGWWPEARLRRYAERSGKVYPRRRLFSAPELTRDLTAAGFHDIRLALPRVADAQRQGLPAWINAAIGGYHLARRLPISRPLLLAIGPTILCTATRA